MNQKLFISLTIILLSRFVKLNKDCLPYEQFVKEANKKLKDIAWEKLFTEKQDINFDRFLLHYENLYIIEKTTDLESFMHNITLLQQLTINVDSSAKFTKFWGCWKEEGKISLVLENFGYNVPNNPDHLGKFLKLSTKERLMIYSQLFNDINSLTIKQNILPVDYTGALDMIVLDKSENVIGLGLDFSDKLVSLQYPNFGTLETNQSFAPEYNHDKLISKTAFIYNQFYFVLYLEFAAIHVEFDIPIEIGSLNYFDKNMSQIRVLYKDAFKFNQHLMTLKPNIFTRFFGWFGSLFCSSKSLIYNIDELIDSYLQVEPKQRLSAAQIADAFRNIANYLEPKNKEIELKQERFTKIEDANNLNKESGENDLEKEPLNTSNVSVPENEDSENQEESIKKQERIIL